MDRVVGLWQQLDGSSFMLMTHFEEYNRIIQYRRSNQLAEDQYGEKHHVVPKSICPLLEKANENIVRLTAQEHFLAHYHLWLAYRDELHEKTWAVKMCYAFGRMKQQLLKCDDVEAMSKLYEAGRIEFAKVHSENQKGHIGYNKGRPGPNRGKAFSAEYKKKLSDAHKGQNPWNKGKRGIYSQETRQMMAQVGEANPNFGKHRSEETRQRISKANKGRKFSEEHRRKLSEAAKKREKKKRLV